MREEREKREEKTSTRRNKSCTQVSVHHESGAGRAYTDVWSFDILYQHFVSVCVCMCECMFYSSTLIRLPEQEHYQ